MRTLITLAALSVASVATASEPSMDAVLDSIDVVPTAAQLQAAWPDAQQRLIAVANDSSETQWHRVRAASMLVQFPSEQTKTALFALATDEDAEVRRAAAHTAARTFGSEGGAELVTLLQGMLSDTDADVRSHVVRSLRWVDAPQAETVLRSIDTEELRSLALRTLDRRAVRLAE